MYDKRTRQPNLHRAKPPAQRKADADHFYEAEQMGK